MSGVATSVSASPLQPTPSEPLPVSVRKLASAVKDLDIESSVSKAVDENGEPLAWLVSEWKIKNSDASTAGSVASNATLSELTTAQLSKGAKFNSILDASGTYVNPTSVSAVAQLPM